MAILKEITKDHVLAALEFIDKNDVPKNNESDRYDLVVKKNGEEKKYPPKYVVAVARHIATNGEISTGDFTAVEAKKHLEGLTFFIADRKAFELTISSNDIVSTDNRFTMNNLSLGDHYEPVNAYFKRADGTTINRNRLKNEKGISNQTLPRIACQVFQSGLTNLTDEEKINFPVCQYNPRSNPIHGIYPTVEAFKRDFHNSIEYVCYPDRNDPQFVFYCWNVFSTLVFVQECLKRFGTDGDKFVLVYKEKDKDERSDGESEMPVDTDTGAADAIDRNKVPASIPVDENGNPLPPNLIYFGAPGTGKSFMLKDNVERPGNHFIEKDEDGESRYERVTFYPTYSYAQFVGCYKPTMESEKAPILSPERLVEELKTALVSWPEWIKVETDVTRIKAFVMLLFGEKFYDSLEPLKEEDLERIRKDAGAKTDYDKAYLSAGMAATKVRRRTSGTSGETIVYKFVPGSFLRILVKALNNPQNNYCLVIEEINRANAAAVFGDVFQLLDRDGDGRSEYEVAASEDVKKFLLDVPEKGGLNDEGKKALGFNGGEQEPLTLKIPPNMYIWATMNSADQGVFPMDTAFKRRWEFEYIDIDNGSADCERWSIDGKYGYKWDAVRRLLNGLLSLHRVNEDKLLGAHFVKPEKDTDTVSEKSFKSKVLMYLWEDAARMCRRQMFGDIGTYSALLKAWDENGVRIFSNDPELEKLKDAADTKKIFAELSKIAPRAESTQPKPSEQTQPDNEPTSEPAP